MAVTKTILKKTWTEAAVRIIGTTPNDASTITLATDLKKTEESLGASQSVHLSYMYYNIADGVASYINVTRNSTVIARLTGNGVLDCSGFGLTDQDTYDITVTFVGASGMAVLVLKKVAGYVMPDQQSLDDKYNF